MTKILFDNANVSLSEFFSIYLVKLGPDLVFFHEDYYND